MHENVFYPLILEEPRCRPKMKIERILLSEWHTCLPGAHNMVGKRKRAIKKAIKSTIRK